MLTRGSADRPDSWLLCTSVTCTKAEQLRVYFFLILPLVQMKSESKGESGIAFSELLKRAQKQDAEAELLNGQHVQDTCEKGVFLQLDTHSEDNHIVEQNCYKSKKY